MHRNPEVLDLFPTKFWPQNHNQTNLKKIQSKSSHYRNMEYFLYFRFVNSFSAVCETKILNTSFRILSEELESISKTVGLPVIL